MIGRKTKSEMVNGSVSASKIDRQLTWLLVSFTIYSILSLNTAVRLHLGFNDEEYSQD